MRGHNLHDDGGLHSFKTLIATLEDGRIVEVVVGDDGHLEIVGQKTAAQVSAEAQAHENETKSKGAVGPGAIDEGLGSQNNSDALLRTALGMKNITVESLLNKPLTASIKPVSKKKPGVATSSEKPSGGWGATGTPEGKDPLDKKTIDYAPERFPYDKVFLAKLNSIMNDNKFDRRLRGRSKGKLDMTRLYKAETGSTSVFAQKSLRRNKQHNVVLVVDESGSMEGGAPRSKIYTAAECTAFLAQHLDKIPGVNLAVIGFNHYMRLHKDFDEIVDYSWLKALVVRAMFVGGGDNADYHALLNAYKILERREGKNLVIFMSDGQPASCIYCGHHNGVRTFAGGYNDPDDIRAIQALVRNNEKLAKTIGVGIQSNATQTPQRIQVNDLAQLKPKILEILSKEIKRG